MRFILALLMLTDVAQAETLIATRTIRAQEILGPGDVTLSDASMPGALEDPLLASGMEARVTLYAGRPIRAEDLGPPSIIDRNQLVALAYAAGPLTILTEGRALGRGGVGDVIRVMNLTSRTTVTGRIDANGAVSVGPLQ